MPERCAFVERILRARPTCEAGPILTAHGSLVRAFRCRGLAVDVHEIKPRGRGGPIVPSQGLDDADVVACCRPCHDWITRHPAEAHAFGFVVHAWENRPSQG